MNELILKDMTQRQKISDVLQKYGARLFNFIRNRVANEQDAEDILQDVWYQLVSLIDTEPVEQVSAWLFRVSLNKIIDKRRRQKFILLDDLVKEDKKGDIVDPDTFHYEVVTPEVEFEKSRFQESLLQAISKLPEKQRQVFVWNELEGMTLQEIAGKSGTNLKTVISRKRYAIAQLKNRLKHFN